MSGRSFEPVVNVEPGMPPLPQVNLRVSPSMFGGLQAQAGEKLGASLEQAGSNLMQPAIAIQELHNQVAGDQAFNEYQKQITNITYGDPNVPGDRGFYGLQGEDALNGRKDVLDRLDQVRGSILGTLQNDRQRLLFDQASRRLNSYMLERIGAHADQQMQTWAIKTQIAGEETKINSIWQDPSEQNFQANLGDLQRVAEAKVRIAGGNDDMVRAEQQRVTDRAIETRTRALEATNPAGALQFLESHRELVKPETYNTLQQRLENQTNNLMGDEWILRNTQPGAVPPTGGGGAAGPQGLKAAIRGQEGSGPQAVSTKGAVGTYQVTQGFFNQYAQPGEDFKNENDRVRVAERGIDALNAKYGGDPSRVAVAYFSGEKNVAPAGSPTPWIEDRSDGRTTVSQYVAGVMGRLGRAGGTAAGRNYYVVGDSYGQGVRSALGAEGDTLVSRPPSEVRRVVEGTPPSKVQGRDVVLSSGIANDPSQLDQIGPQIDALLSKGARSVTLVGVGDAPKLAGLNDKLAQIAQDKGIRFSGAIDPATLGADRIHPTTYAPLARQITTTPTETPVVQTAATPQQQQSPNEAAMPDEEALVNKAIADAGDNPRLREVLVRKVRQFMSELKLRTATDRTDLERQQGDLEAAALSGLEITIPEVRMRAAFPPAEADRRITRLQIAQNAGQIMAGLKWASPEEIDKVANDLTSGMGTTSTMLRLRLGMRKSEAGITSPAAPGEQPVLESPDAFKMRQQIAGVAGREIAARNAMLTGTNADPGLYVLGEPTVQAAAKAANDKDPSTYEAFANQSLAVQTHLGVPPTLQHVLARQQASRISEALEAQGADVKGQMEKLAQQWGNAWPHVFADLVTLGKLPSAYQSVAALEDPKDAALLARAINETSKGGKDWNDILGTAGNKSVAQTIKQDVRNNPDVMKLMRSLSAGGSSAQQIDGILGSIETLAYAKRFYNQDGAAAENAAKAFTSSYTFLPNGGARVPNRYADAVTANAAHDLGRLTKDQVAIPQGFATTPEERRRLPMAPTDDDYLAHLKAAPEWTNSPRGDAIWLRDPEGRIVRDRSGNPFSIPFTRPAPVYTAPETQPVPGYLLGP